MGTHQSRCFWGTFWNHLFYVTIKLSNSFLCYHCKYCLVQFTFAQTPHSLEQQGKHSWYQTKIPNGLGLYQLPHIFSSGSQIFYYSLCIFLFISLSQKVLRKTVQGRTLQLNLFSQGSSSSRAHSAFQVCLFLPLRWIADLCSTAQSVHISPDFCFWRITV